MATKTEEAATNADKDVCVQTIIVTIDDYFN